MFLGNYYQLCYSTLETMTFFFFIKKIKNENDVGKDGYGLFKEYIVFVLDHIWFLKVTREKKYLKK